MNLSKNVLKGFALLFLGLIIGCSNPAENNQEPPADTQQEATAPKEEKPAIEVVEIGAINDGTATLTVNLEPIQNGIKNYWITTLKVPADQLTMEPPNIVSTSKGDEHHHYLTCKALLTTAEGTSSKSIAIELSVENQVLLLASNAGFQTCSGVNCTDCGFLVNDKQELSGCDCEGTEEEGAYCNHSISAGDSPLALPEAILKAI